MISCLNQASKINVAIGLVILCSVSIMKGSQVGHSCSRPNR